MNCPVHRADSCRLRYLATPRQGGADDVSRLLYAPALRCRPSRNRNSSGDGVERVGRVARRLCRVILEAVVAVIKSPCNVGVATARDKDCFRGHIVRRTDKPERIKWGTVQLIPELTYLGYEKRLNQCGLTTLELRRLKGGHREVKKILKVHPQFDFFADLILN